MSENWKAQKRDKGGKFQSYEDGRPKKQYTKEEFDEEYQRGFSDGMIKGIGSITVKHIHEAYVAGVKEKVGYELPSKMADNYIKRMGFGK